MPSARTVAGLAVIAVGFLLVGGVFGLALTPSQFYWTKVYPDGTQSAPLVMTAGVPVKLRAEIMCTGGPSPTYWDVYATIAWDAKSSKVDLGPLAGSDSMLVYDELTRAKSLFVIAWWEASWTPPDPGADYTLKWTAEVRDSGGTLLTTKVHYSYAQTQTAEEPPIQPDGWFYVAGWKLDPSQTALNVTKPEVQLNFVPTQAQSNIEGVYVEIENRTSKEKAEVTIPSGGAKYTLPDYGLYDVRCYIDWIGGEDLYKAGLTLNYPAPPPIVDGDDDDGGDDGSGDGDGEGDGTQEGTFFSAGRIVGVGLVAFGAIILFSGRRRRG